MLARISWLLPSVLSYLLLGSGLAAAQEAAAPPPGVAAPASLAPPSATAPNAAAPAAVGPTVPAPVPATIREAQPSLWYLKDKEGRLQPVLGWTIEELEDLYQLKHRLRQPDQAPRFSLQALAIRGEVKGDYAELAVQLKVLVRDGQGVRIPLRLNQGVLREAVAYHGSAQQSLSFEEAGDGYVLFLRGGAGEVHELTLPMLVPLSSLGTETRLRLTTPRAISSELKLQVPLAEAVARVSEGATLLPSTPAAHQSTELTVLGLGGDVELAWRKAGDPAAEVPTVLEAVGDILAKADGRTIDLEARLRVRGYGGEFDRFRVRLPKGAELTSSNVAGYTVVPLPNEAAAAELGPVVEVQLPKKTSGEVEISLAARLPHEAGTVNEWSDLAGFEVLDAVRQWGHVAVATTGDWHILWGPNRGVRQVDELPEWLRSENLVAGFEYFQQPFSLRARVVPRRTRVRVEPEYLLLVEPTQVRLEAKLKYTVRGAKAFAFHVDMPHWQLDEVGPENVVDVYGPAVDASGVLSIPLVQPTVGQIEITLRAKLPISGQQHSLRVELPRPQASSVGPAAVVVLPADNVELTPNAESMVGLVRQQTLPSPEIVRPPWQQPPLFYRVETPKAVFAGDMRIRSRELTVDVASQISLTTRRAQVEQRLNYLISYEPTDRLLLEVPRALAGPEQFQVLSNGQPLAVADLSDLPAVETAETVQRRVALPGVPIGPCELVVRYQVPLDKLAPAASSTLAIPLVMPAEGKLTGNTLVVQSREGLHAQVHEGPWRYWEGNATQVAQAAGLSLASNQRTSRVLLSLHREPRDPVDATVVSRGWVQSWLVGQTRQERAVFCFTSNQRQLHLQMPADAELRDVELLLDGEAIQGQSTPEREFLIPLKGDQDRRPHRLEAWYHFRGPRPNPGLWRLELPRLGRDVWVQRLYWELILPHNEHLLTVPSGFTPEFRWSWTGLLWGREAVLDPTALEAWSGTSHKLELPAGANVYLFSSLGTVRQCELRTAPRSLLVLLASGFALVAGLLWLYVPLVRHPGFLLVWAVLLLAAVLTYPGPALLLTQAASLGVVLAVVAGLLKRSFARRRAVPQPPSVSAILERGSTQIQQPLLVGGESTDTAPTVLPTPTSESHA